VLDEDLRAACLKALTLSRSACLEHASSMTWEASAQCFLSNLTQSGVYPSREDFTGGGVTSSTARFA
jgi:hypothetical protein